MCEMCDPTQHGHSIQFGKLHYKVDKLNTSKFLL